MQKKVFIIVAFLLGSVITLLFLFGWKWFPQDSSIDFPTLIIAFGIIIALGGVIWNTNRQINNQNISIKKQIENQNKESHRPFISVKDVRKLVDNYYYDGNDKFQFCTSNSLFIGNSISTKRGQASLKNIQQLEDRKVIKIKLILENIGYGVATNICCWGISGTFTCLTSNSQEEGEFVSTESLGVGMKEKTIFNLTFEFDKKLSQNPPYLKEDMANILLFYSDLNDNVFSTIITVFISDNINQPKKLLLKYVFHPNSSAFFYDALNQLSVDYSEMLSIYKTNISLKRS